MIQIFQDVNIDWLAKRRLFIGISVLLMFAGLVSSLARYAVPGGTDPFNLGVDFRGGTQLTVKFKQRPSEEAVRAALEANGIRESVVQSVTNKPDEVLIKIPRQGTAEQAQREAQVDIGRTQVEKALSTFGEQAGARIIATDAVGEVAGAALRNQAVSVTLLALVGILLYIAYRFEWAYGAAAVITVFHDVLVTLGFFSLFQWEVNLTVIAALLTLVGFSVNDTIVTFDRVRENLRLHRRESLYKITNDAINQTLSRTIITGGLVFLSVLALVLFGGDVLRGFSLALLIGIIVGTYSTIAIASPIMVWWQQRVNPLPVRTGTAPREQSRQARAATANAKGAPAGTSTRKAAQSTESAIRS